MQVQDVFRALGDPSRCRLYERIAIEGELNVAALTRGAGISQPAVSQHLSMLGAARLVQGRRVGRNILYSPTADGLAPVGGWMGRYAAFWETSLDRLEQVLKEMGS